MLSMAKASWISSGLEWSQWLEAEDRAGRPPRSRSSVVTTVSLLIAASCTTEEIVTVRVVAVDVVPEVVNAVEGDRVQLAANVRDDRNELLSRASVQWSSDDPLVASVDSVGVLEARREGTALIRATYQGVSGTTSVRVLEGPFIELGRRSLAILTAPGGAPAPQLVAVTNGGAGSLAELSATVQYAAGQPVGWLSADLSSSTAPADLMLIAQTTGLASGVYLADVRVASPRSPDAAVIRVELSVAGFSVVEVGGSTAVREGGAAEQLSVVLTARPAGSVALAVVSSDPGELIATPGLLRFTPSNWATPQSVTVRAVDDAEDDGDQTATVTISVDDSQSDDAFEPLADRTITAVVSDNDDARPPGILVTESGGDTRVSETGTFDSITVALRAPPASNVVIAVSSANIFEVAVVSAALLTFTPTTWSTPQVVVLKGMDDFFNDGNRRVRINLSVVDALSDEAYDGRSARVTARNIDNEEGGRDDDEDDDDDDDDDDEDDDDRGRRGGG